MLDMNFKVISAFIIALMFAGTLTAYFWMRKEDDRLKRAFNGFTIMVVALGASTMMLWLSLPNASVLNAFGYPDIEQVRSLEALQKYLQNYNKALVRTIQVIHLFLFIFVWWFLTVLLSFSKVIISKTINRRPK